MNLGVVPAMQKIIIKIGRLWFLSVVFILILTLFVGEIVVISRKQSEIDVAFKKQSDVEVIVASSQGGEVLGDSIGEVDTAVISEDARPLLIKKYLAKYKSPLLPYSDLIFKLSQTYGFDYYWMVAIAQQESNLCKKIPENSFNCWGYGINSAGTLRFESYELALQSYAEYLNRAYFKKGLNTPELIMKKYCPHSDGSWARGVTQFISEIENGKI